MLNEAQFARMEERLQNWGQWARTGGAGKGHCGSVEHRYIAEKLGEGEQAVHRTPRAVDAIDAELIEDAVSALKCRAARFFLMAAFVEQWARPTLQRVFRLRGDHLYVAYRVRAASLVADEVAEAEARLVKRGKPLWAGVARIARGRV
jgi:hypothetical protein